MAQADDLDILTARPSLLFMRHANPAPRASDRGADDESPMPSSSTHQPPTPGKPPVQSAAARPDAASNHAVSTDTMPTSPSSRKGNGGAKAAETKTTTPKAPAPKSAPAPATNAATPPRPAEPDTYSKPAATRPKIHRFRKLDTELIDMSHDPLAHSNSSGAAGDDGLARPGLLPGRRRGMPGTAAGVIAPFQRLHATHSDPGLSPDGVSAQPWHRSREWLVGAALVVLAVGSFAMLQMVFRTGDGSDAAPYNVQVLQQAVTTPATAPVAEASPALMHTLEDVAAVPTASVPPSVPPSVPASLSPATLQQLAPAAGPATPAGAPIAAPTPAPAPTTAPAQPARTTLSEDLLRDTLRSR